MTEARQITRFNNPMQHAVFYVYAAGQSSLTPNSKMEVAT